MTKKFGAYRNVRKFYTDIHGNIEPCTKIKRQDTIFTKLK